MIAKVDRDDYTLDDIFFFCRAIPKGLDIREYDLYFSFVHDGSLCLGYLIPEYLYFVLFPLTTKLQQQLASIGITELTCGENKYDLREFSKEEVKHSSTDIDICDPLWYENTSTSLHEAAWRGLKDEVQWLLNVFGYNTYHRGLHGWTPLHSASYGGHIEILQLLIHQYGIDPNEGDDNSVSSIHMASYKGHLSIVQYLVDTCHVPPDQPDNSNNTALLYTTMGGHSDLVEFFIERNSCQSGELALVQKLESLNLFSPDDMTKSGAGILHFTCRSVNNKSVELFKYLLHRYLYSIDVKDSKYGRTPLHFASWFALSSVVEYIVSIQELELKQKLILANEMKELKCFLQLSRKLALALTLTSMPLQMIYNLNANDTDTYGRTPLVYSSWSGSIHSVKYLINNHNSDPNITDKYGMTCLHHSCRHGHIDITQYLIEVQHCDIKKTDNEGRTLVHYAAWSGNFDLVQYLITEQGLSPTAVTKNGLTALHYASVSLNLSL
uniref:Uncharacterized protein n=1 Tax=Amphimedon queenslandica TaxID=400682 RepID=A0A1X7SRM3_AMPQE